MKKLMLAIIFVIGFISSANAQYWYYPAYPVYAYPAPIVTYTVPVVPVVPQAVQVIPVAPVCWWQADPYSILPELFGYNYIQVCN